MVITKGILFLYSYMTLIILEFLTLCAMNRWPCPITTSSGNIKVVMASFSLMPQSLIRVIACMVNLISMPLGHKDTMAQ